MAGTLRGIDASSPCSASTVECLRNSKIAFVCRYYSRTTKIKGKRLTKAEAKRLSKGGLRIVTVYEDGPTEYSYFSASRGTRDANGALRQAGVVGQPRGSAIYFAVDYDASPSEIRNNILAYFQAVNETMRKDFIVGVYGSGSVCAALLKAGLAQYAWLAQSTGWSGSKTFRNWTIKQEPAKRVCGLKADPDVAQEEFGGFVVGRQS